MPSERDFPSIEALNGSAYPARVNAGEGAPSGEAGIKRYLAALVRYKWMIIAMVVVGTGLGAVLASRQTKFYQTRARIWIAPGLAGGQVGAPIKQGQLLTQGGWEQLLRSSAVLDSVVLRQRLYLTTAHPADSVAFTNFSIGRKAHPGTYSLQVDASRSTYTLSEANSAVVERGNVGDSIGRNADFLWVPDPRTLPSNRALEFTIESPSDVAQTISDDLVTAVSQDENFLMVRMTGPDRVRVTAILTAVVDRFEQVALELKRARLTETAEILQTQLNAAEGSLTTAENELESFKIRTITLPSATGVPVIPGLQTTDPTALGNYWQLTSEKDQYSRDLEAILHALESKEAELGIVTALQLVPSVSKSSQLQTALNEASSTDANIRSLLTQLTDQHPLVVTQQERLDSLKSYVIPAYANDLVRQLTAKVNETDRLISNSARELREIPERSKQEMMLERRRAIAEELYRYLERETHTARLAEVTTVPDMQILDRPSEPVNPLPDERLRLLLMFIAGSFGLGMFGAILRDRFDPRLRYPDEVTGGMGLFILGAVPALRRGKLGSTDMALAVEAFRAIQLSMLHAHGAEAPLVVTLTSPGASDGKSFVTSNLAIAFADMGHRTIIVDGDVRRGTVHQLMGTTHKPGLTDYLAGHATRDQIVQNTRYTLLDMIGCGSRGEAGPKLLGSAAMSRLMDDLRTEYDVILVDSPPLGACVDPMILGTLTRNLVLVLRTGTTDRAMAESKLLILDRLPVRVVGAVLNDVPARGPYRYYSYLSGYEVLDDAQTGQEVGSLPSAQANGSESGTGDQVA
jgi:capsular exopolysaccharide synthesis family protein